MPALKNRRHEAFAQELFRGLSEGLSQGQCYSNAGYTANANAAKVDACRLLKSSRHIVDRVRELQAHAAESVQETVEKIGGELNEALAIAKEDRSPAAMVAAATAKAKLYGLQVERTEMGKPGDFTQAQSTNELVDAMLRQANPHLEFISEEMREAALVEMERHIAILAAIATGRPDAQRH